MKMLAVDALDRPAPFVHVLAPPAIVVWPGGTFVDVRDSAQASAGTGSGAWQALRRRELGRDARLVLLLGSLGMVRIPVAPRGRR